MSNNPPLPTYHFTNSPHSPVFVGDEVELSLEYLTDRMLEFPDELDATHFKEHWLRRAIIEERQLSLENLPDRLNAVVQRSGWFHFLTNTPDTSVTINRTIVREYYAILQRSLIIGGMDEMGLKIRGVDVRLQSDWINSHYGIPNVPSEQDYFMYYNRTQVPRGDYFNYKYVRDVLRRDYPSGWLRIIFTILTNRVFGAIYPDYPGMDLKILAYVFLRENVNVGKYIIVMIQNIALGAHGNGYAFFPYLITALARHYEVPEYDTDDISLATSPPIVYENEHPYFT